MLACNQWWVRLISFLTALLLSAVILIFPQSIAADIQQLNHGLLSLMLLAVCACFVHGLGFKVKSVIVNYMMSPFFTLPLLFIVFWRMWV